MNMTIYMLFKIKHMFQCFAGSGPQCGSSEHSCPGANLPVLQPELLNFLKCWETAL